jgi:hypothetical protein
MIIKEEKRKRRKREGKKEGKRKKKKIFFSLFSRCPPTFSLLFPDVHDIYFEDCEV